jgi:hypothetical protein
LKIHLIHWSLSLKSENIPKRNRITSISFRSV